MDELTRLKSEAYDCICQIEQWQTRLRETNQRIAALVQQQTVSGIQDETLPEQARGYADE